MTFWYESLDGTIEINIHGKELCVKLAIYEDYNEMHGQQNKVLKYKTRIEINIHGKELCVKLAIYKDYKEMHGQQNIKFTYGCSQNPNRKPEINVA